MAWAPAWKSQDGESVIAGKRVTGTMTFNGKFPGPTLKVRPGDVMAGLDLTGHFLETFVFAVFNRPLPPARHWLIDRLKETDGR